MGPSVVNASTVARGDQQGNAQVQLRVKWQDRLVNPLPGLPGSLPVELGLPGPRSAFLALLEGPDEAPAAAVPQLAAKPRQALLVFC
jgi:hypothetical protein